MLAETAENRELRVALWRKGVDLGRAWFVYGDDRQKQLHDARRGTSASLAYRKLMAASLFGDIGSGLFVTLGYRTDPTISDGPVVIPADLFEAPMTDEWGEGSVVASGWRYERVTVLPLDEFQQLTTDLNATSAPSAAPSAPSLPPLDQQDIVRSNKPGRKNTYALCAKVFDQWAGEQPELLKLSAEKLWPTFREAYDEINEASAKLVPAPAERTLRKHLQSYHRMNSEKIGNN